MNFIRSVQLTLVVVVSLSSVANGHDPFDGDWRGKVVSTQYSIEMPLRFIVKGDKGDHYFCHGDKWHRLEPSLQKFGVAKNNALLVWIDEGGYWTETQTFSLSYVNKNTLEIVWTRHVNNIQDEGDFETWYVFGHGTLTKSINSRDDCDSSDGQTDKTETADGQTDKTETAE